MEVILLSDCCRFFSLFVRVTTAARYLDLKNFRTLNGVCIKKRLENLKKNIKGSNVLKIYDLLFSAIYDPIRCDATQ